MQSLCVRHCSYMPITDNCQPGKPSSSYQYTVRKIHVYLPDSICKFLCIPFRTSLVLICFSPCLSAFWLLPFPPSLAGWLVAAQPYSAECQVGLDANALPYYYGMRRPGSPCAAGRRRWTLLVLLLLLLVLLMHFRWRPIWQTAAR